MVPPSLDLLLETVRDGERVLILTHNNPDPDAIAAAAALGHLLATMLQVEIRVGYKGFIGRAENKALVRFLDNPLRSLDQADLEWAGAFALVDTQAGAGNSPLSKDHPPSIVIDHHPSPRSGSAGRFVDVRVGAGSTSTILTEYLRMADLQPGSRLATALFYGIKTDTMGLGRSTSQADIAAYFYLQPLIDVDGLAKIEGAQVSTEYFRSIDRALRAACVYGKVIVVYLERIAYADLTAEVADFLLRLQGIQWVVCMGLYHDDMILSVRTRSRRGGAGELAIEIVGKRGLAGGHGMMAGGHVPLNDNKPDALARKLGKRALRHLKISTEVAGKPLI